MVGRLFFFLFVFQCAFAPSLFAQIKSDSQIERKIKDLESKIVKLNEELTQIKTTDDAFLQNYSKKLDSLQELLVIVNKGVDDTHLRQSLKLAENTLNNQDSWITGFGTIYTYMTVIIAVIALLITALQIIYFFSSIRPALRNAEQANRDAFAANREANNTINLLSQRMAEFDRRVEGIINAKFEDFTIEQEAKQINFIIDNLLSPNQKLKEYSAAMLNSYSKNQFSEIQLLKVINILSSQGYLDQGVEEAIVYFLTKKEE